jgi:hypothetical protein
MSLLSACKAVVGETGLGLVPSTVISNPDPGVVQLYYLALRSAEELAKKDWQRMVRTQTITTVASQEDYALPSDLGRYIGDTAWDTTNYWPMGGSMGAQQWSALKYSLIAIPETQRGFRLFGNEVLIIPTPSTSGDSLVLEYVRNTPWLDSTGATWRTAPTVDTDITGFPENLLVLDMKWRLKEAKGMPYEEAFNEAERAIDKAFAQDTPKPILNFSRREVSAPSFVLNVPPYVS